MTKIGISGIGITSAIGQGKASFKEALFEKRTSFSYLRRPGRSHQNGEPSFVGAEINDLKIPVTLHKKIQQKLDVSSEIAVSTLAEAWEDAGLDNADPNRVGLIVAGSNLQQRTQLLTVQHHQANPTYTNPNYGMSFLDTDIGGLCSQYFGIRGGIMSLGAASASGQVALLHGLQQIQAEVVDKVIILAPMQDLSYFELQALRNMGAMGTSLYFNQPKIAYRPFDQLRDGFIFGEACAAIIIENMSCGKKTFYAEVLGGATISDAHRDPNPSLESEVEVIKRALKKSKLDPQKIDYLNPHASGSKIGDEIEIQAIKFCGLAESYINTTKSICGHSLSAASAVEIVAILLQMQSNTLHGCNNLIKPISDDFNWVFEKKINHKIELALSLSFGFSGINSAICLKNLN